MKLAASFLLSGSLLLAAMPALANSDMQKEIEDLREDLMVLQRQIYRGAGSSNESSKSAAVSSDMAAAGNVQVKIGEYDEVIRKVNGRMDTLEYQIKQLDSKLDKINRDMEIRFKILEGRPVPANLSAPVQSIPATYESPVATGASKAVTGDSIQGDDLAPIAGSNVVTDNKSKLSTDLSSGSDGQPQKLVPDAVMPVAADNTKPPATVGEMYASGMEAYNSGYYDEAELAFQHILEQFPKDKLAGNAQYWLGEVYFKQNNYNKAIVAFKNGYEKYHDGNKAPDSLFKLGLTFKAQKENKKACIVLSSFNSEFPKANADLAKRVKNEASKLGCK